MLGRFGERDLSGETRKDMDMIFDSADLKWVAL
jgi:hypothetical protein